MEAVQQEDQQLLRVLLLEGGEVGLVLAQGPTELKKYVNYKKNRTQGRASNEIQEHYADRSDL